MEHAAKPLKIGLTYFLFRAGEAHKSDERLDYDEKCGTTMREGWDNILTFSSEEKRALYNVPSNCESASVASVQK